MRPPTKKSRVEHLGIGILLAFGHLMPLAVLYAGMTTAADWVAFGLLYVLTGFAATAGLHRYFAHRSFRTSRLFQFLLGAMAATAYTDPITFTGKHGLHHRHADTRP